jgi:hypothetical protein
MFMHTPRTLQLKRESKATLLAYHIYPTDTSKSARKDMSAKHSTNHAADATKCKAMERITVNTAVTADSKANQMGHLF